MFLIVINRRIVDNLNTSIDKGTGHADPTEYYFRPEWFSGGAV